jgi:hypothetical protein
MISGTDDQFSPVESHPYRVLTTTLIAANPSTTKTHSATFDNELSHERCLRGSARLIRNFDRESDSSDGADEVAMTLALDV